MSRRTEGHYPFLLKFNRREAFHNPLLTYHPQSRSVRTVDETARMAVAAFAARVCTAVCMDGCAGGTCGETHVWTFVLAVILAATAPAVANPYLNATIDTAADTGGGGAEQ